jgi:hypothetical protein
MLNDGSKQEFKIHIPKTNFDLLTYPNVRSAMAKNQDKQDLLGWLTPARRYLQQIQNTSENPWLENPTRKLVQSTPPNLSLPMAVNFRKTTLGGKVTGKEHSRNDVPAQRRP